MANVRGVCTGLWMRGCRACPSFKSRRSPPCSSLPSGMLSTGVIIVVVVRIVIVIIILIIVIIVIVIILIIVIVVVMVILCYYQYFINFILFNCISIFFYFFESSTVSDVFHMCQVVAAV